MQRLIGAFVVLCLIAVFGSGEALSRVKKKWKSSKKGWVFDIRSDKGGRQTMYLSSRGVRFKYKTFMAILVAPKFDATIFNTSTKKYTVMPHKVWMKRYGSTRPREIAPTGKSRKMLGFKARSFRTVNGNGGVQRELWMTDEPELEGPIADFVAKVMNVPRDQGIPLKITVVRKGKIPEVEWDVFDYSRVEIPESRFQIPEDYVKVKSEMELLIDEEKVDGMADLLR